MSAKPDLLYAALKAQVGRDGTVPDLWKAYLEGLGYSGAFPDMAARHAAALGVSVQSYLNTDGSVFTPISTGLTEHLPTLFTQSSTFGSLTATTTNMRDANGNGDAVTGGGTNSSASEWIKADLGSALEVSIVTLGAGNLAGYGALSTSFNDTAIQYSTDDVSWTPILPVNTPFTDSPTADRDINFYIPPTTARYWRITKGDFVATATFRLYGYSGGLVRRTGITYSQSSVYGAGLDATEARLNELPHDATSGAATNSGAGAYIRADLGASYDIKLVVIAGGNLPGWGVISTYLNSRDIQTSPDGITWTTQASTGTSMSDVTPTERAFPMNVNARYVQLVVPGSGFLSTSAFRIYTSA